MDYRFLGASGFKVPVLGFGTGTFGGKGPLFAAWGSTDRGEARRLIDVCLEAGANLFDSADAYSDGEAEKILGDALKGKRDRAVISTKIGLRVGDGANETGASRHHLIDGVERALRRLQTDYIDLLQLHQFDAMTPLDAVMSTLDDLVRAGKVRYIGASNFAGWELMPLGADQGVAAIVWSPLGWGRLTGRIGRGRPLPQTSRLHETAKIGPPVDEERLFRVTDALEQIAEEVGKSVAQVALRWVLQRPTVSSVLIGARDEAQLRENLGAVGWSLSEQQLAMLDAASAVTPPYPYYPYWNGQFTERNPPVAMRRQWCALRDSDRLP